MNKKISWKMYRNVNVKMDSKCFVSEFGELAVCGRDTAS